MGKPDIMTEEEFERVVTTQSMRLLLALQQEPADQRAYLVDTILNNVHRLLNSPGRGIVIEGPGLVTEVVEPVPEPEINTGATTEKGDAAL